MNKRSCQLSRIIFSLSVIFFFSCSNTTNLISNGKSEYKIFVSDKAIAPEKYAAGELQTYLYRISGCKIEITHNIANEAKLIYVGFKEAPSSLTSNVKPSDFGKKNISFVQMEKTC